MIDRIIRTTVLTAVLALAGCAKPVPQERAAYAGEWRGQAMVLLITRGGSVAYERLKGGAKTKITGPIRGFVGNNFVVGLPVLNTTFEVSVPPHEEGGKWKMTVDGVELTRVSGPAPALPTPQPAIPPGSTRI